MIFLPISYKSALLFWFIFKIEKNLAFKIVKNQPTQRSYWDIKQKELEEIKIVKNI